MILLGLLLLSKKFDSFTNINKFSVGRKDINFSQLTKFSTFTNKSLKSNNGQFYFIEIKNRHNLSLITSKEISSIFVPKNCISPPNLFKAFLQPNEIQQLLNFDFISIYNFPQNFKSIPLNKSKKAKMDYTYRFIVDATPNFPQLFKDYGEIHHLYDDTYSFIINPSFYSTNSNKTNYLKHIHKLLQSSDDVFSYDEWPRIKKLNRYGVGYIQTNKYLLDYDSNCFLVKAMAPASKNGLTGKDQVVTISDSGLDSSSYWLKHTSKDYPYDIDDSTHRKIVRYERFSENHGGYDKTDASGHGTHVATTCIGKSLDNDYTSLYNGIAPDAKAYFIDLEDSQGNMYGDSDISEHVKRMRNYHSHISSNSWGYEQSTASQNALYNVLSVYYPDILFVFAAGNEYNYLTISSPASAKNVLTVGALNQLETTKLATASNNSLKFEVSLDGTKDQSISCRSLNPNDSGSDMSSFSFKTVSTNLFASTSPISLYNIAPQKYSASSTDYSNKAVIVMNCDELANALAKMASYIIVQSITSIKSCPTTNQDKAYGFEITSNVEGKTLTITPQLKSTTNAIPSVALYSSKGPSTYGAIKPEIVAPGTYISSSGKNGKALETESGTSMATPLAAGALTLLVEYLQNHQSLFSKSKSQDINSHLLKAIAVACADKENPKVPDFDYGFGSLNLANAIPELQINTEFTSAKHLMSNSSLLATDQSRMEFLNGLQLIASNTYVYSFVVTSNSFDVRVAFSYLDQSASSSDTLNIKAHLNVETPNKDLLFPLGKTVEDYTSTVSRIYIPKEELIVGQYKIIITTSEAYFATYSPYNLINGSLVVIGDINSLTDISSLSNAFDWSIHCNLVNSIDSSSSGNFNKCQCKDNAHGLICQDESTYLKSDFQMTIVLNPFETKYFYQVLPDKVEVLSFSWFQDNGARDYIMLHVNPGNKESEITLYKYYYGSRDLLANASLSCISVDGSSFLYHEGTKMYFSYTNYGSNTVRLKVANSMVTKKSNSFGSVGFSVVAVIVFLIIVVIIIIIAVVCARKKKKVAGELNSSAEMSVVNVNTRGRNHHTTNPHVAGDLAQVNNGQFYAPPTTSIDADADYMNPAYRPNSRIHDENEEDSLYAIYRRSQYNMAYNDPNNNENKEENNPYWPTQSENVNAEDEQAPQYFPPTTNFENQVYPNQNNANPYESPYALYMDPYKPG